MRFIESGVGPIDGAASYAASRRGKFGDPEKAIKRIVNETVAATASAGFVTGLGGLATMPVAIPANLAGTMLLNVRMVAAVADLRGWDIEDDAVRLLALLVIAGESPVEAMSTIGIKVGQKLTENLIASIPVETIRAINKKAGFYLVAKYGTERSAITLAKAVPLVGGVVGGSVDAAFTRSIGSAAKKMFPAVSAWPCEPSLEPSFGPA